MVDASGREGRRSVEWGAVREEIGYGERHCGVGGIDRSEFEGAKCLSFRFAVLDEDNVVSECPMDSWVF